MYIVVDEHDLFYVSHAQAVAAKAARQKDHQQHFGSKTRYDTLNTNQVQRLVMLVQCYECETACYKRRREVLTLRTTTISYDLYLAVLSSTEMRIAEQSNLSGMLIFFLLLE